MSSTKSTRASTPAPKPVSKQEQLRTVAAVLSDAAAAARGLARAHDNYEAGQRAGLPYKKIDALGRAITVAEERWGLLAPRVYEPLNALRIQED
jgi:hypothetical protein